jgi:hypothetical protein
MKNVLPTLNICRDFVYVNSSTAKYSARAKSFIQECKWCRAKAKTAETIKHKEDCVIGSVLEVIIGAKKEVKTQIVANNLSYIHNCIIDCKKAPKEGLFEQTANNGMITRLKGYAIVPVETYEQLSARADLYTNNNAKARKKLSAKVGSFSDKKSTVKNG